MIKNEAKNFVGDFDVDQIRSASENRGKWVYQLVRKSLDAGMSWDEIREGIFKAGAYKGYHDFSRTTDLKKWVETFFTEDLVKLNDAEIVKLTDDTFTFCVNYCPMAKAWTNYTDDKEFIDTLCDACMEVDRGTAASCGLDLVLEETIGKGDGRCIISFRKKTDAPKDI